MIFLLEVDLDYGAMGNDRDALLAEEFKRTKQLTEQGIVRNLWRKANAMGAIAIWDVQDHETLWELISTMPLYRFFKNIKLIPLVELSAFTELKKTLL